MRSGTTSLARMRPAVLDERWLAPLGRLRFVTRRPPPGPRAAWRTARRSGQGLDFFSHREYMPGDDYRSIDWRVLARLDRPFVKVYAREEETPVEILLDCSASMARPHRAKFAFARSLAACLGYVALAGGDHASLGTVSGGGWTALVDARAAHTGFSTLVERLSAVEPGGATRLDLSAERLAAKRSGPCLTLLVSDLMDEPQHVERSLSAIWSSRRDAVLIHVLAPEERLPALSGRLRLVDEETSAHVDVEMDERALSSYTRALALWQGELARIARARHFRYVPVDAASSPFQVVVRDLRTAGVVR